VVSVFGLAGYGCVSVCFVCMGLVGDGGGGWGSTVGIGDGVGCVGLGKLVGGEDVE